MERFEIQISELNEQVKDLRLKVETNESELALSREEWEQKLNETVKELKLNERNTKLREEVLKINSNFTEKHATTVS